MPVEWFLAGTAITLVFTLALAAWWPRWRLRRVLAAPFPEAWRDILARRVPVYERLDSGLQRQLQDRIKLFLHGKTFYGCGGLEMHDEIRLTIAAQACLLLLNRRTDIFGGLRYILVYPAAFVVPWVEYRDGGVQVSAEVGMEGESWDNGKVVLSWEDVRFNAKYGRGRNLVLHEFAHQLDHENGATDGAPRLRDTAGVERWQRVMSAAYAQLQYERDAGREGVIDSYGATDPAEFFAVVTEAFYERPHALAESHADVFAELLDFYCVDPRAWQPASGARLGWPSRCGRP
jgi:Mlc titration factor MtfA (ptsG expression regulator)